MIRNLSGMLGLVLLGLSSCTSIPLSAKLPPSSQEGRSMAARVLEESNRARRLHGLLPLPANPALSEAAEHHARFLAANVPRGAPMPKALVHHDFPGRSTSVMLANSMCLSAEIVVAMPPGLMSPSAVTAAWLGSPGHRGKLLGSWDLTGVGASKASDGTWYVVQWFGNSRNR